MKYCGVNNNNNDRNNGGNFGKKKIDIGDPRNFPYTKNYISGVGGRLLSAFGVLTGGCLLITMGLDYFWPRIDMHRKREDRRQNGGASYNNK